VEPWTPPSTPPSTPTGSSPTYVERNTPEWYRKRRRHRVAPIWLRNGVGNSDDDDDDDYDDDDDDEEKGVRADRDQEDDVDDEDMITVRVDRESLLSRHERDNEDANNANVVERDERENYNENKKRWNRRDRNVSVTVNGISASAVESKARKVSPLARQKSSIFQNESQFHLRGNDNRSYYDAFNSVNSSVTGTTADFKDDTKNQDDEEDGTLVVALDKDGYEIWIPKSKLKTLGNSAAVKETQEKATAKGGCLHVQGMGPGRAWSMLILQIIINAAGLVGVILIIVFNF